MKDSRINTLDGLRFLAITLIIASHCDFLQQGGLGNCIFFSLSGFFAAKLWKNQEYGIKLLTKYYFKRMIRIMPVFWLYLIFTAIFFWKNSIVVSDFDTDASLVLNMFFIKSRGHLWFLQQEVFFIILVPFVIMAFNFLKKIWLKFKTKEIVADIINVCILLVICLILIKFQDEIPIRLYGNGGYQTIKLGYFLLGMTTGYLYIIYDKLNLNIYKNKIMNIIASTVLVIFPIFCLVSSNDILNLFNINNFNIGWKMTAFCTICSCIVIFILVTSKKFKRFYGNKFFAFVGKISFSMYLFHWPFLVLKEKTYQIDIAKFALVYFVTICVGAVVYKYVERPCINLSKK